MVKIHEDVTHQQVERNLLRLISVREDPDFPPRRAQKPLKSVILAEYFAVRVLYSSFKANDL